MLAYSYNIVRPLQHKVYNFRNETWLTFPLKTYSDTRSGPLQRNETDQSCDE